MRVSIYSPPSTPLWPTFRTHHTSSKLLAFHQASFVLRSSDFYSPTPSRFGLRCASKLWSATRSAGACITVIQSIHVQHEQHVDIASKRRRSTSDTRATFTDEVERNHLYDHRIASQTRDTQATVSTSNTANKVGCSPLGDPSCSHTQLGVPTFNHQDTTFNCKEHLSLLRIATITCNNAPTLATTSINANSEMPAFASATT